MDSSNKTVSIHFMILGVLFCVCLITANVLATKPVASGVFNISAGLLVFPISYIVNDCIVEVWGIRKAWMIIRLGFVMNVLFVFFGFVADLIPAPDYWDNAEEFHKLFGVAPRVVAGSLTAFVAGSCLNAFVMDKAKERWHGKRFRLRAILSTLMGETVDSLIFFPIALGGVIPWDKLAFMMFWEAVLKTLYEVVALPVTVRVVRYVQRAEMADRQGDDAHPVRGNGGATGQTE